MSESGRESGSKEFRDPASVIMDIAQSRERSSRESFRRMLQDRPREEVVPLLALELSDCRDAKRFEKLANTLARVGGEESTDILAQHARTQRRFTGLAIHALSRSDDERVLPLIMDMAEFGRHSQRVSAIRALGRLRDARSIEMLCRIAGARGQTLGIIATYGLTRMGGYEGLTKKWLLTDQMEVQDKLNALRALESVKLSWRGFSAERALERTARTSKNPTAKEAEALLGLLHAHDKLLRPSTRKLQEDLLRASTNSDIDSATLLRGAECGRESDTPFMRRLIAKVRKTLSRK